MVGGNYYGFAAGDNDNVYVVVGEEQIEELTCHENPSDFLCRYIFFWCHA